VADDGTTRGRFLTLSSVGLGSVIGGVIGVPATAYLLAPVTEELTFKPISVGKISNFTKETGFAPTAVTFVEDPSSPATSVQLAYVHYTGKHNTSTDWLAPDAMFVVFSNHCTHMGCPVLATGVGFSCPCHGSQFNTEGGRIAGPAVRALDRFQWEVRKGELVLTNKWSTDFQKGKLEYFPVKNPGQPVDVLGSSLISDILYPHVTYTHGPVPKVKS
jgi:Rieske Fe-S protein